MRRLVVPLVVLLGLVSLVGCDDGDDQIAAEKNRYCELAAELDRRAEGVFAQIPPDAPPNRVERATSYFLATNAREIAEIQRVAPPQIQPEVRSVIATQRNAAEGKRVAPERILKLSDKVREYEDEQCDQSL